MKERRRNILPKTACIALLLCSCITSGCRVTGPQTGPIRAIDEDHPAYRELKDGVYATNLICCSDEPIRAVLILYEGQARVLRRTEDRKHGSLLIEQRGPVRIYHHDEHAPDLLLSVAEPAVVDRHGLLLVNHPNETGWATYLADPVPYAVMEGSDERMYINAERLTRFPACDLARLMRMTPQQVVEQFGGN